MFREPRLLNIFSERERREKIKNDSAQVDAEFVNSPAEMFRKYSLVLPVPTHHPRATSIRATMFKVDTLEGLKLPSNSYPLVDSILKGQLGASTIGEGSRFVDANEATLKEITWLKDFMDEAVPASIATLIGVGGGVLLNAAAYLAEKKGADFISVPTTVLAAADSAIGGLVRINKVDRNEAKKSYYKSVYEPSEIILDPRLLAALPREQISFGLSEIIKHGVYQSPALLEYLASDMFEPFRNQDTLLEAICWTVALKNVAIVNDPDSESFGGEILRGGHKLALSIEEQSRFSVSHGQAVAVGVYQDTIQDHNKIALLDRIYQKLDLPRDQADLQIETS